MKKNHLLLFLAVLFIGCNTAEKSEVTSSAYSGARAWAVSNFPLNVKVSDQFSGSEITLIQDMGTAWEDSMSNRVDFFDLSTTSSKTGPYSSNALNDSEYGIYKSTAWPGDFSSSALAVTQIYVSAYISGQISHADIVINDDNYNFRTSAAGSGYDLGTVVIHELGHFIGLDHSPSSGFVRADSVMYPAISSSESKRIPQTYDTDALGTKYPTAAGASVMALQPAPQTAQPVTEGIMYIIELMPSGDCIHKEKGIEFYRHNVGPIKKY